jgi:hypothetical protein
MGDPRGIEIPPLQEGRRIRFSKREGEAPLDQVLEDAFNAIQGQSEALRTQNPEELLGAGSAELPPDARLALPWARSALEAISRNAEAVASEATERLQEVAEQSDDELKERTPEQLTSKEYVERFNGYSESVHLAIIEAFPERRTREFERRAAEEALQGEYSSPCEELGGEEGQMSTFRPLVMRFEAKNSGIFKPSVRERDEVEVDGQLLRVRLGVEKGTFFKRAALTAVVDRVFDFDVVPATAVREGPEGIGSVQEFRDAKAAGGPEWTEKVKLERLQAMAALDFLVGHMDRWFGNVLLEKDGGTGAIDNDLTFSKLLTEDATTGDQSRSEALEALENVEVPQWLREKISAVLNNEKMMALLREGFELAFSGEVMPDGTPAPQALFDQFIGRARRLAPENPDDRPVFPQPGFSLRNAYKLQDAHN